MTMTTSTLGVIAVAGLGAAALAVPKVFYRLLNAPGRAGGRLMQ